MSRKSLDYEMQTIRDDLLILSSMVENAICQSVTALREQDLEKARQIMTNDRSINKKRYEIEAAVMVVIATQSPVTRDLRFLSSALAVCSELERIGDYAKTISKVNLRVKESGAPRFLSDSYQMGVAVMDILHRAMTAFILMDAESARRIIPEDDVCDALYQKIYNDLMNSLHKNPRDMEYVNYFLWVAHNLERAGDRVTNICERAIYVQTGEFGATQGA
jgi:phosphate transport system protein